MQRKAAAPMQVRRLFYRQGSAFAARLGLVMAAAVIGVAAALLLLLLVTAFGGCALHAPAGAVSRNDMVFWHAQERAIALSYPSCRDRKVSRFTV